VASTRSGTLFEPGMAQDRWLRQKSVHSKDRDACKVLAYYENIEANWRLSHQNTVYAALLEAYNTHQDLVLSPDDIWMVVCLQFSKHVNKHAEALREHFVSHQGKKKLEVTTWNDSEESEWGEFFSLMRGKIAQEVSGGVVGALSCDFSTTGPVESFMSAACVMDSFKQYFSYGRCIPLCGIRNVCFMGSLEDWQRLEGKASGLGEYDVNGEWQKYLDHLTPILREFVNTFQGQVNVEWWNKVMNITQGRLGSGSTSFVDGWILNLFGLYSKTETCEITGYSFDVPVHLENRRTGTKKDLNIVGGFGGVNSRPSEGRLAFRPQLSMIVFHDPTPKAEDEKPLADLRARGPLPLPRE